MGPQHQQQRRLYSGTILQIPARAFSVFLNNKTFSSSKVNSHNRSSKPVRLETFSVANLRSLRRPASLETWDNLRPTRHNHSKIHSLENSFNQPANSNSLFGGNKPAAPQLGNSMSGQNMSGSLFGNSMGASAMTQGTLTASINQPIAENLPIFSMLPPGPRIVDLDLNASKKKPGFFLDMPTRSPIPRVQVGFTPANSKLRGFGTMSPFASSQNGGNGSVSFTNGKPNALSLSRADGMSSSVGPDFLGRSGSPALGSGGRQSVKKVILEKKIEPTELFVKTGSPGALRTGKSYIQPCTERCVEGKGRSPRRCATAARLTYTCLAYAAAAQAELIFGQGL